MPVTREQLVDAAIEVLDESGLPGLTLRQVANRLGVQAPALYWHVRNKRQLLDLMAEAIITRSVPPEVHEPAPGQPWWEWLTERTTAVWSSLRAHPDSALVIAGNRPTWETLPHIERLLAILVGLGFPPTEALDSVIALGNLVTGCVLEEQASAGRPPDDEDRTEAMRAALGPESRFPTITAASAAMGRDGPGNFEYALRLMIAGLRGRLAELRTEAELRDKAELRAKATVRAKARTEAGASAPASAPASARASAREAGEAAGGEAAGGDRPVLDDLRPDYGPDAPPTAPDRPTRLAADGTPRPRSADRQS
jgi:TetR/AcrR family tetracycline transcriptional repressor